MQSVITYVNSILDMKLPLERKRVLAVRGTKAERGELVTPSIKLERDPSLKFMSDVVSQIKISIVAKKVNLPEGVGKVSKYTPNIF